MKKIEKETLKLVTGGMLSYPTNSPYTKRCVIDPPVICSPVWSATSCSDYVGT